MQFFQKTGLVTILGGFSRRRQLHQVAVQTFRGLLLSDDDAPTVQDHPVVDFFSLLQLLFFNNAAQILQRDPARHHSTKLSLWPINRSRESHHHDSLDQMSPY